MGGVACTQPETPAPTTYTITFDSGVESISVEEGAVAKEPAKPTKDGYTFVEWLNGETAYDWTAPVTGNLTLTAKWAVEKYTIDYKLPEGSTNDESNLVEYTIESETISELKDPKLPEGLTFLGWYTDENCTVAFESIENGSTGNVVIYAKYTDKQTFTVTYYIGDKANTKLEEKDAVFTLTGYDLFTDKECTKAYKDPITSDITLYAKVKKMTVKFDSNGGSAVAEAKVDYNTAVAKPTDPTLAGSTFQGWTLDGKAYDFNAKVTNDITLKATWKPNAAEEPTTPPAGEEETLLPTTFKIGETYSGTVTYQMKDNLKEDGSSWGNAIGDLMFNFDLTGQTLKAKDIVKVSFKITESSSDKIKNFGYNSAFDWGTYNSIDAKALGSVYTLSFTVGTKTTFENNLCGFKINPADGEGELKGKDLVLKIEEFTVTLVPYVEGAQVSEILLEEDFKDYSTQIKVSTLQEFLDKSTGDAKVVFTYHITDKEKLKKDGNCEWVAKFIGWEFDVEGNPVWNDSVEVTGPITFDTQASYADVEVDKELTKDFLLEDLLPKLEKYHTISIQQFGPCQFTKAEVIYTQK